MSRQRNHPYRVGLFIGLVILIVTGTLWLFSGAARNLMTPLAERYRLEADGLLAEGHLAEAVLTYRQAVETDSSNEKALQSLAEAYRQQGRLRMAERYQARVDHREPVYALPEVPPESSLAPVWISAVSEAPPLGGVLVSNRVVTAHEDGTIAAVDAGTGVLLWSRTLPEPITSAPAADGNRVVVGGADGRLTALRLSDGEPAWQVDANGPVYAAPVFFKGVFYCPSSSGTIFAISSEDGGLVWQRKLGSPLNGTPAVTDDAVYAGANDGHIYALKALDGSLLWPNGILTGGAVESQPAVVENRVIVGSGDGRVYALDAASGGRYWRASTPDAVYAQPLVLDGQVFIASSGRSVSAVDLLTGERLWQASLPAPLRTAPAAAGKVLYQSAEADANLYLLELGSGKTLPPVPTGDWLAGGPWVNGEMLYVLGKDGAVLGYKIRD